MKLQIVALFLLFSLATTRIFAFGYVVSDRDWAAWPEYCRVKYTGTPVGWKTRGKFPKEVYDKWEKRIGSGWTGMQHYCVGLIYVNRAQASADPKEKENWSGRAINEIGYTYSKLNPTSGIFSRISAHYAIALDNIGERDKAIQVLEKGIKGQPYAPESYIVKSQIERGIGDFDAAEKTLLAFLEIARKDVAEAQYHLAYIYIEKEEFDKAKQFTKSALKNGYPLSGLKRKLQRLGEWD